LADVLWYGRDDWYKNPAAFRQLASACPDVSFATIGRADLPASDNVRDLGWRDDVAALLPRVRVLLMTSRFEGSPNLALQSLACGVPIAAFDIAATRELAADHPARVFLAPPGDIAGLRAALSDALDTGPGEPADVPSLNDVRNQWLDLLSGLAPRLA
jgi:glycosyltransferase involved in cell wall biosynthesis